MPSLIAERSFRQRLADKTPAVVRKLIRVTESYLVRIGMWRQVARELRGADPASTAVLRRSIFAAPFTALRDLDSFQPPRLMADAQLEVAGVGRFAIRAETDDILHVLTSREPEIRQLLERRLQPGDVFVDAGANIGFYSVLAARLVGTTGQIVAFEMMPDTAEILRGHVRNNALDAVQVLQNALSDSTGAKVIAQVMPGKHGQASIVGNVAKSGLVDIEVETVTLDDALREVGPIRLIKMDIEGAEFLALAGAAAVLSRTECVVFESNQEDARIFALLEDQGFAVERLRGHDFLAQRVRPASTSGQAD